jgi:alpha-glucosidase (family GH31 glycosyl hydrolase)
MTLRINQTWGDWFSENAEPWWAEALANWSAEGVVYSGIWLDMNEVSSFCTGSWYILEFFATDFRLSTVPLTTL